MTRKPQKPTHSPLDKARAQEVVWARVAPVFEAMRGVVGASFVYVISEGDDGPVKIGVALDPVSRLRAMQTGNPRRLRIEHVLVGWAREEAILHQLWERFAILADGDRHTPGTRPRTEWFHPEGREKLTLALTAAAKGQAEWITTHAEIDPQDLRRIIIEAHVAHGLELKGRDEIRRLVATAGYVVTGRSTL